MNFQKSEHQNHTPWNKGKLVGQKLPLKLKKIWAIRVRYQLTNCIRDLALFNLAIDSSELDYELSDISYKNHQHQRI